MLYRTLKRMIERGQTEGLESKMDIFFAASKPRRSTPNCWVCCPVVRSKEQWKRESPRGEARCC